MSQPGAGAVCLLRLGIEPSHLYSPPDIPVAVVVEGGGGCSAAGGTRKCANTRRTNLMGYHCAPRAASSGLGRAGWRGEGRGQGRRCGAVLACSRARVWGPLLCGKRGAPVPRVLVHARVAPLASTPSPTTHSRVPPVSRGWRAWRPTAHTSMRTCLACTVECSGCPGAGLGLRGSTSGDQSISRGITPQEVWYH